MSAAREPTPIVAKWRQEEAEASAWFWDRYKLRHLKAADAGRYARLLAAIHALDMACAHEQPGAIATAGDALVAEWRAVVTFMAVRALRKRKAKKLKLKGATADGKADELETSSTSWATESECQKRV